MKPVTALALACVLVATGGAAAYLLLAWTVTNEYVIEVTVPIGTDWCLWLPRPDRNMTLSTRGNVSEMPSVDTAYGTMLNLSGSGSSMLSYSSRASVFGSGPESFEGRIELSAKAGSDGF